MKSSSTVQDFSKQWTEYTKQQGYYASNEIFQDYCGPLFELSDLKGKRVAEVGSGNGRFVKILSQYASSVVAIEPSEAINVSREYAKNCNNVEHIQASIYELPEIEPFDVVFCLGVVHHTPDPVLTLKNIKSLLKPEGDAILWVYGKEGNEVYLALVNVLRIITTMLPVWLLKAISKLLLYPLKAYISLCRVVPLPMRTYMRDVLGRYDNEMLELTIFDQLNPSIAFYWTKEEFKALIEDAGFTRVEFHNRHGYSWTARAGS